MARKKSVGTKPVPRRRLDPKSKPRDYLEKLSKKELIEFILEKANKHPQIAKQLLDRTNLDKGNISQVTATIRQEIQALEPDGYDYDTSSSDDFDSIHERLCKLLDSGYPDAVVDLGTEFIKIAPLRYEYDHTDDWGISCGIENCLEVIVKALPLSSLSPAEQLVWYIDAVMDDDYCIFDNVKNITQNKRYKKEDWAAVRAVLEDRLEQLVSPDEAAKRSEYYQRERLARWIETAMEKSGNKRDAIDLLKQEAPITHCYPQLVTALLSAKQREDARQWAIKGFTQTIDKLPGIAWQLVTQLKEMAKQRKEHDAVAALLALEFFYHPDIHLYRELKETIKPQKQWDIIRTGLLTYLETGKRPDPQKQEITAKWPLPATGLLLLTTTRRNYFPDKTTLIDIAIDEKRPDEVLKWYRQQRWSSHYHHTDDKVADAIKRQYPEETLAIWKRVAEWEIDRVKPAAYQVAAPYLKKMRALYRKLKRGDEWNNFLASLKAKHKAKRRLMEILAKL